MDKGAVFTATAVSAAFATIIMGVFANYPVALAAGMGLNAYFAYSVVPMVKEMGVEDPWKVALAAILVEGIIFIILSLFKFREALVNSVPANLKYGISAGIGLFIAIVGLKGAGLLAMPLRWWHWRRRQRFCCACDCRSDHYWYYVALQGARRYLWGILIYLGAGDAGGGQRLVQRYFHHSQPGTGKFAAPFVGADFLPV